MGAKAARLVLKVEAEGTGAMVTLQSDGGAVTREPLIALSRVDLLRAALNVGAGYMKTATNEEIAAAIRERVHAPGYSPREFVPRSSAAPAGEPVVSAPSVSAPVVSAPLPAPVVAQNVAEPETEAALAALLASLARSAVNPAEVERIASRIAEAEVLRSSEVLAERVGEVESRVYAAHERLSAEVAEHAETLGGMVAGTRSSVEALVERVGALEAANVQPLVFQIAHREPVTISGRAHAKTARIVEMLHARLNVFAYGPAGTGKSTIARVAAEALGLELEVLSCSLGMTQYDFSGFIDARGEYIATAFRHAYEHGRLLLIDEVDYAATDAICWANAAVAADYARFPDRMVSKHPEFRILFTGNTSGEGPTEQFPDRVALDKALRDRVSRVELELDPALERSLVSACWSEGADEVLPLFAAMRENAAAGRFTSLNLGMRRSCDYATLRSLGWSMSDALTSAVFADTPSTIRERVLAGTSAAHTISGRLS